jgi:hypothetical protein
VLKNKNLQVHECLEQKPCTKDSIFICDCSNCPNLAYFKSCSAFLLNDKLFFRQIVYFKKVHDFSIQRVLHLFLNFETKKVFEHTQFLEKVSYILDKEFFIVDGQKGKSKKILDKIAEAWNVDPIQNIFKKIRSLSTLKNKEIEQGVKSLIYEHAFTN